MKVKTSELIGSALDWAVAKADKCSPMVCNKTVWSNDGRDSDCEELEYSTDWSQGGPIIERERIITIPQSDLGGNALPIWTASYSLSYTPKSIAGPTPLIAACRCFVASKLGDEVDIPEELL